MIVGARGDHLGHRHRQRARRVAAEAVLAGLLSNHCLRRSQLAVDDLPREARLAVRACPCRRSSSERAARALGVVERVDWSRRASAGVLGAEVIRQLLRSFKQPERPPQPSPSATRRPPVLCWTRPPCRRVAPVDLRAVRAAPVGGGAPSGRRSCRGCPASSSRGRSGSGRPRCRSGWRHHPGPAACRRLHRRAQQSRRWRRLRTSTRPLERELNVDGLAPSRVGRAGLHPAARRRLPAARSAPPTPLRGRWYLASLSSWSPLTSAARRTAPHATASSYQASRRAPTLGRRTRSPPDGAPPRAGAHRRRRIEQRRARDVVLEAAAALELHRRPREARE